MFASDNFPRPPDRYVPDTTNPYLSTWFLDSQARKIHLFFSEPVVCNNISGLIFYLGTEPSQVGRTSHTTQGESLMHASIEWRSLNMEAVLTVTDFCTSWTKSYDIYGSMCPPYTFMWFMLHNDFPLYLTMAASTFSDKAKIPNSITPITTKLKLQNAAPGNFHGK